MASQAHAQVGQEENRENRYRDLLAQLVEVRNDLLFQKLVNPQVEEGPAPPPTMPSQRSGTRRQEHEPSSHTKSHKSRRTHHESKGRTHHSRHRSPSLSSSSSTSSTSTFSSQLSKDRTHRRGKKRKHGSKPREFKKSSKFVMFITFNGHFAQPEKAMQFIRKFAAFGSENFYESSKLRIISLHLTG